MGTSMAAADAIMGVVGSQTAASLMSGRRSQKLGAGMATMVSMTKKKARKMSTYSKAPTRRTGASASNLLLERQFMPTSMDQRVTRVAKRSQKGGGGYHNRRVNWSGTGLPGRRRMTSAGGAARKRTTAKRTTKRTAAEKVCRPVVGKDGKAHQTVLKVGTYQTGKRRGLPYHRCVKAGGQAAKEVLGIKGCPTGQTLKTYTTRVPVSRQKGDTRMRQVKAQRCIKAVGAIKNCPANQVIIQYRQKGRVGPRGQTKEYNTVAKKCVLPSTAAKKGYQVLGVGTLPVRRSPRLAMSMGM